MTIGFPSLKEEYELSPKVLREVIVGGGIMGKGGMCLKDPYRNDVMSLILSQLDTVKYNRLSVWGGWSKVFIWFVDQMAEKELVLAT